MVIGVGLDVDPAWSGRSVVAHLGIASSGYAERAVAAVASLHEVPAHLDAASAVAMIGTGRTASGVLAATNLVAGDVVLIPAAAGGLGNLFVQEARHVGAFSVGLAGGAAKVEAVAALGADVAIDYLRPDWPDEVRAALGERSITVVLDGVGGTEGRRAFELLGPGGRHIVFGYTAGEPTADHDRRPAAGRADPDRRRSGRRCCAVREACASWSRPAWPAPRTASGSRS